MTIELITIEQHKNLHDIFNKYPKLTLQNNGYEYINRTKFNEQEEKAFKEVSEILKKHIKGFSSFSNFRIDKNGQIQIRLQYKWDERFTGVGYILLDELLNGFNN